MWRPYRDSGYKTPAPPSRDIAWFLTGLLSRNKVSQEIAKWATAKAAEAAVANGSSPKGEEELKAGVIKVLVAGGIQTYTPVILRGKWKLNKRPPGEARMLVSDMGAVLLGNGVICFPFSPDEVFVVDVSAANFKPLPPGRPFKDPVLTVTEAAPQFWRRIRDATIHSAQSKLWGYAEEDFPS